MPITEIQIPHWKTTDGRVFSKKAIAEAWQAILDNPNAQPCRTCKGYGKTMRTPDGEEMTAHYVTCWQCNGKAFDVSATQSFDLLIEQLLNTSLAVSGQA